MAWSISGGSGAQFFTIDETTGQVSVGPLASLDFEAPDALRAMTLRLRATDSSQLFDERDVTIALQDIQETPVLTETFRAAIPENTEGAFVFSAFSLVDPDAADAALGIDGVSVQCSGGLTVEIQSGSTSDQINLASLQPLDFESYSPASCVVQAVDTAGNLDSKNVGPILAADVNEPPTFDRPVFNVFIDENLGDVTDLALEGDIITFSDPDAAD